MRKLHSISMSIVSLGLILVLKLQPDLLDALYSNSSQQYLQRQHAIVNPIVNPAICQCVFYSRIQELAFRLRHIYAKATQSRSRSPPLSIVS